MLSNDTQISTDQSLNQFFTMIDSEKFKIIKISYEEKFKKYDNKAHLKKDEHIKSLLEQAENKLKSNEFKFASKLYNEAFLQVKHPFFASNDDEKLIFCKVVLKRSNAFYNLEYYEEFLQDFNTLFYYCENLLTVEEKEKLQSRKNICKGKLDEALDNLESNEKLNLKKMQTSYVENEKLYGISEKIDITFNQNTGRGLIANKEINENELIAMQKPFVSVLSPHLYTKNCYNCLVKLSKFGGFYPCRQCTQVRFCSYECENECWFEYHQIECTYLDLLNYSNSFHFQPKLALKLVLKIGVQNVLKKFENYDKFQNKNKKKNKKKNKELEIDYSKLNYDAICSLQDHSSNCPDFSPPITLMLLFLIQKYKELTDQEISILGCVLLKHLQQIHTNSKYILSKNLRPEISNRHSDLLLLSDVKIGCALFQTFSLINHNCQPNVISFHFTGNQLHLKSLRKINVGEEINISYGVNYQWHRYNERQEFLNKFYFFKCNCEVCKQKLNPICHALKCEKCPDAPVFPFKANEAEVDAKCLNCKKTYKNFYKTTYDKIQSSSDLLDKVGLLFSKGNDSDFNKVKIILEDIQEKFSKVLYKNNQKMQIIEQQLSITYKLLKNNDLSVKHAEKAYEILNYELNEHYSGNFNTLIKLIDRQVILFRECNEHPQNLDHLKLDYLKNLKKAKQWIDVNLPPTSDEYMYFLSFLSLSFSSYTNLGKTNPKQLKKE